MLRFSFVFFFCFGLVWFGFGLVWSVKNDVQEITNRLFAGCVVLSYIRFHSCLVKEKRETLGENVCGVKSETKLSSKQQLSQRKKLENRF